jgi:hypothetical protein
MKIEGIQAISVPDVLRSPPTVRQAVGEVQSLELHQYKVAMVVSTIMIKNKVFLQYIMVFNEILSHNLYLFV